MKLLVLCVACACLIASLRAATVEPVAADQKQVGTESTPTARGPHPDCHQPQVVGRCLAYFPRFAYNVDSGACEEFIYGGCGANANNFETQAACEQKCLNGASSPTELPSNDEVASK